MKKHKHLLLRAGFCSLGVVLISMSDIGTANAAVVTVNAADDIYGVGQSSDPGGGNLPTAEINLDPANDYIEFGVTGSLTCGSPEGCITINGHGNFNDPDGVGAAPSTSYNSGYGSLSGITAPGGGYLVGVFVDGAPSGNAPAALDFTSGGGTSFSSLDPELDQVFFIGDGQTGDGTGTLQELIFRLVQRNCGSVSVMLAITTAAPGVIATTSGRTR